MPEQSVFAIILAAGESARFGSVKLLSEYAGETLVRRAVRLAEAVCGDRCVLVVGKEWQRVLAACGPLRGYFVNNDKFTSGMASSIVCGIRAVGGSADAVLLTMADQPLITAEHLKALISRWTDTPESIVASEYADIQGPPIIFPARCFESLKNLEGDQGARSILLDGRYSVIGIGCDAAAIDVDTPEDLAKL